MELISYFVVAYIAGLLLLVFSYAIGNYWYDRQKKSDFALFKIRYSSEYKWKDRVGPVTESFIVSIVLPLIAGVIILSILHRVGHSGEERGQEAMRACVEQSETLRDARGCGNLPRKELIAEWYDPAEDYDDRDGF